MYRRFVRLRPGEGQRHPQTVCGACAGVDGHVEQRDEADAVGAAAPDEAPHDGTQTRAPSRTVQTSPYAV